MDRLPRPAQFLLRIDDLCPTIHARRWGRLRDLLQEHSIRAILAVVPANEDAELRVSPPDAEFWQQMRDLQSAGAAIALHGYTHVCSPTGRGIIPLHRTGEFAGLGVEEQRQRIATGRDILRGHGLNPQLWVAPRHSFDWNTLRALRSEGIRYLSDGLARRPFERGGVTWIPMQLWAPIPRPSGVWTICIHPNSLDRREFQRLRRFVQDFPEHFTSFHRVVEDYVPAPLGVPERLYEMAATLRMRLRRTLRRGRRG
jgi:peptidoglycan/xylan/chitin deacetylase (PgdA/CDA1 family)